MMATKNPYFAAREHLKEAGGNPAGLMGKILALEKLVMNFGNPQDPNSIYSQFQKVREDGLLSDVCEQNVSHTFELLMGWTKDYKDAIDVLTRERKTANKREEKPTLDLTDNVVPIKKRDEKARSKRIRNLEMD